MDKKQVEQYFIDEAKRLNTDVHTIRYIRNCYIALRLTRSQMVSRQNDKIASCEKLIISIDRRIANTPGLIKKYPKNEIGIQRKYRNCMEMRPRVVLAIARRTKLRDFIYTLSDEDFTSITTALLP